MTDFCIICETEPIDNEPVDGFRWFAEIDGSENICPWCVRDMYEIRKMVLKSK